MFSHSTLALAIAACAATVSVPAAAHAQQAASPAPAAALDSGAASATPFDSPAIVDDALQAIAGREDTSQVATASQTAGVSRNSVGDNSTTGDARVSDNAFQNLSGLSILNVNTGNNVAINAAMNVNITITPGR